MIFHGEPQLSNTEEQQNTSSALHCPQGIALGMDRSKSLPSAQRKNKKLPSVSAHTQRKSHRGRTRPLSPLQTPVETRQRSPAQRSHSPVSKPGPIGLPKKKAGPGELTTTAPHAEQRNLTTRDERKEDSLGRAVTSQLEANEIFNNKSLVHWTHLGKGNSYLPVL